MFQQQQQQQKYVMWFFSQNNQIILNIDIWKNKTNKFISNLIYFFSS